MANRFFPNYDSYLITSPFGLRTLGGQTRMHNGIDLVAKAPGGGGAVDAITAHTGGTVTASGYDPSAGYLVKIRTGAEAEMVYYHLREESPCKVGDTVEAGQVIGFMGATGKVTGAHLHFGIRVSGRWIDPAPYLNQDYDGTPARSCTTVKLPVLYRGVKCESVRILQVLLNHHMNRKLEQDGSFGPATEAAVEAFQRIKALAPDKRVGPATWAKLLEVGS